MRGKILDEVSLAIFTYNNPNLPANAEEYHTNSVKTNDNRVFIRTEYVRKISPEDKYHANIAGVLLRSLHGSIIKQSYSQLCQDFENSD
jgi:hypothetical protein